MASSIVIWWGDDARLITEPYEYFTLYLEEGSGDDWYIQTTIPLDLDQGRQLYEALGEWLQAQA